MKKCWDACLDFNKLAGLDRFNENSELNISDVMGSLSRFEKFFRNEHPTMFYHGDKMNKNEILKLVEEFFKTVKDNDEGMWKDGIDSNTMGIGL
jgi:hypothetical protein